MSEQKSSRQQVGMYLLLFCVRLDEAKVWNPVDRAILHASHNLYVQGIFTPLTRDTGKTAWFIDEFGAILPLVALGFGIYFWFRRNEVT